VGFLKNNNHMKDKYVQMRNDKVMDLNFLYEYAISKGFTLSVQEFNLGAMYLDVQSILDKLDNEFELVILFDVNGNFVKVV